MKLLVTGHNTPKVGGRNVEWTKAELERCLRLLDPDLIIVGLARGVDLWAAAIADRLLIPYVAILPHPQHDKNWSTEDQAELVRCLDHATEVRYASPRPVPSTYLMRNQLMAQLADEGLVVWDGGTGQSGTYHAVRLLQQFRRPYVWIDPVHRRTARRRTKEHRHERSAA